MPFYIREMDEMTMGPYGCIEDAIEAIAEFEEHDRSIGAFVKDSYRIVYSNEVIRVEEVYDSKGNLINPANTEVGA